VWVADWRCGGWRCGWLAGDQSLCCLSSFRCEETRERGVGVCVWEEYGADRKVLSPHRTKNLESESAFIPLSLPLLFFGFFSWEIMSVCVTPLCACGGDWEGGKKVGGKQRTKGERRGRARTRIHVIPYVPQGISWPLKSSPCVTHTHTHPPTLYHTYTHTLSLSLFLIRTKKGKR
jgi:hypothetical protein